MLCYVLRTFLRRLVPVCLVAFAAGGAVAEPRGMASPDEQHVWQAVGRLNITGQGFCTATLVAPDIVVTAAHCLVNRRTGRPVAARDVHFLAGFRIGTYAAHRRGHKVSIAPGFDGAKRTMTLDLAMVQLDAPVPDSVQPIPLAHGVRPEVDFTLLSYGMDRSQILSAQHGCVFEKRMSTVIFTTCEGLPGVSGAPLLQRIDGQLSVVAVVSSILARQRVPLPKGPVLAVEASAGHVTQLWRELGAPGVPGIVPVMAPQVLK